MKRKHSILIRLDDIDLNDNVNAVSYAMQVFPPVQPDTEETGALSLAIDFMKLIESRKMKPGYNGDEIGADGDEWKEQGGSNE